MRSSFNRKALRAEKKILATLGTVLETRYRLSDFELRPRYRVLAEAWRDPSRHVFRASLQVLDPHVCLQHLPPLDERGNPFPGFPLELVCLPRHKVEVCPHWVALAPLGLLHLEALKTIEDDLDIPFRDGLNGDYEGCSFVSFGETSEMYLTGSSEPFFRPAMLEDSCEPF